MLPPALMQPSTAQAQQQHSIAVHSHSPNPSEQIQAVLNNGILVCRRGSVSGATPAGRQATGDAEAGPVQPQPGDDMARSTAVPSSSVPAAAPAVAAAPRSRALGSAPSEPWVNYDDRPAQAKGVYNFEGASAMAAPPGARRSSLPSNGRASGGGEGGPAPQGFPTGGQSVA
jgi:hypothetical protein